MKMFSTYKAFLILLLSIHFLLPLEGEEHRKTILFISSYHPAFSTFFQQVQGLKEALAPEGIHLDVEFMDTKRFPGEENRRLFREYLAYKMNHGQPYDLIITGDDNALILAIQEKEGLFLGKPVLFFGVNDKDLALSMNRERNIRGVMENVSMADTIQLMIDQNPTLRNIWVIVDGTPSGQGDLKTFWSTKSLFPGYNFLYFDLRKLTWNELSSRLEKLDRKSSVLLLSAYSDSDNLTKDFYESLELIKSSLSVPIYHLWYHGLGDGIIGGKLISHYEQARTAAQIAIEVVQGRDISSFPVIEESPNLYFFDYRELQRFNISFTTLPEGSEFINEPDSFLSDHMLEILVYLSIFLFLLLVAIILMINFLKRKKAEKSQAMLRRAAEQIMDTIELYDKKGRLIYANPAFLTAHGYEMDKVLGKKPEEIFSSAPPENVIVMKKLWLDAEKGIPWRGQFTNTKPDGSPLIQDISFSPFYDDKGKINGYISVKKDITPFISLMEEKKSILENLLKTQKNESVGQLSGGMAQAFNNLLSGISSASGLLLSPDREMDDKARDYARIISDSCEEGTVLVGKLLKFSQVKRSAPGITDLEALVDEVVEILQLTIKKKIDFVCENLDAPQTLICDSTSLQNALLNLGINAAQAIESTGTVSFSLMERSLDRDYCYRSLYSISPGRYCSIRVSDTGTGIGEEDIPRIFDPFYTTREAQEGLGLGLTSVKSIIEEHKGCIEVISSPEGTVFELLIPLDGEPLNS